MSGRSPLSDEDANQRRQSIDEFRSRADAILQRGKAPQIDGLDLDSDSLLEIPPQRIATTRYGRSAGEPDPAESRTLQAILVIHRGLVHYVGQRAFRILALVTEVDHVRPAKHGQARVARRGVDEQPVIRRRRLAGEHAIDDRERCDIDRKSTRLNSSHSQISYAVFCLKKKKNKKKKI